MVKGLTDEGELQLYQQWNIYFSFYCILTMHYDPLFAAQHMGQIALQAVQMNRAFAKRGIRRDRGLT
jgi:hypothetical protein